MKNKQEENVKETVTTIETILKGNDLKQFKAAQKTWQTMPKTALTMLDKMESIGLALNTLYNEGVKRELKKEEITIVARKAFEGLNRRERSEYRKLANNAVAIKLFVEFEGVKSANPTYLVNAWVRAMKEDIDACKQIEMELQGGLDANGQSMNKDATGIAIRDVSSKDTVQVIADSTPIKTGIRVQSEPLTGNEVVTQLGFIVNQIKTLFNEGKLSADNLTIIEQHLTSCIQHINDVNVDVALAM